MKLFSTSLLLVVITALISAPVASAERLDDPVRAISTSERPLETARDRGFAVRDGRVQVVVVAADEKSAELAEWLEWRGALFVDTAHGRVQAFVPPVLLSELGRHPDVLMVERPLYAEVPEPLPRETAPALKVLAVTSEGLAPMNVEAWHTAGVTGTGVKVGVIDLQFDRWEEMLGVELPPAGRTTYMAFGGVQIVAGETHGTACAEIVHDIAPDADLFLAHIRSNNDLYNAMDWFVSEGVGVVTMSLGFYLAGPGDGTGELADEIADFIAVSDALFITSAGNERMGHWQGQTIDDDSNGWVDVAPGEEMIELAGTVSAGNRVRVNISWDDWTAPTSDYSLHLYNLDGAEPVQVASADRSQTGQSWQTPTESISYTASDGGRFGVRINRTGVSGTNDMEFFSIDSDLVDPVAEGSLTAPGDGTDVVGVAAVSSFGPYGYRNFSSAGPANGPGGTFDGGEVKPDLSGYDGVSTATWVGPFFGTSAAAPHVAGAAALVRSNDPALDQAQTRAFLEGRAADLGPSGKDNDYGWGRVFLGAPPGSSCTYAVDPTEIAMAAAGGAGAVNITTQEGCPWIASSRVEWLTIAPPTGVGSGFAGYRGDPNPGATRIGELVVADFVVTVTQAGSDCTYEVDPLSLTYPSEGGEGTFDVVTGTDCPWEPESNQSWITVTGTTADSVLYTVAANAGPEQRTGTISVADRVHTVIQEGFDPNVVYMVAGVAETEGAQQTRWKSDLAILNTGENGADVDLVYRHQAGSAQSSLAVAQGGLVELVNVAVDTFGLPNSAGAVELSAPAGLIITARTYNDSPDGTFGQFLPGVTAEDGLSTGQIGALSQLNSGSGFRTNIGFVDLGGAGATARVRLFDGDGSPVGSELAEIIPAGGWHQRNRVFHISGAGSCQGCYALVEIAGGQGPIWAYASVVDNASGDPTTIPMELQDEAEINADMRYMVAGVAESEGANETRWKSNLALLNLSGATVSVDLEYRYDGGTSGAAVTLADGEMREFEDVVGSVFNAPDSAGAVNVSTGGPLVVTARTFNDAPQGTFGQFLPGLDEAAALSTGDDGFITQLKNTEAFRTNVGFTNYGDADCTVRTYLHDDLGDRKSVVFTTVPAGGWVQENRIFDTAGIGVCPLGYALSEVITAGCTVWAYGSVVDNASGDPTTVPVAVK